ncbi:hypothetical protein B6U67_05895 [Methanosarcinales archaeon ex4484_138]|nr:MAG: hypothetical protein B6U67_05895 [Methanosarcinales archaeon ex4484_138]RLG24807.1 MAG: hypothetical protein DRN85_07110 [Methanosarcinales archaeon]RLG26251.1 MAG: hypothetical protein DRN70_03375 [Methanosarcinales archaeon]
MIVSFTLTQIESRTYISQEEFRKYQNININYDINLRNPRVSTIDTPFGDKETLRVEYAFSINYLNPSIGHIRFEGSASYTGENLEEIKKNWDSGKAPTTVQNEVANTTVTNLAPLAISISKNMGLPPAIPIPKINFEKQKQKQKGTEAPANYYV